MEWGFVGGAYQAANPMQDNQVCINWFVELAGTDDAKVPAALLGCPGLVAIGTGTSGEGRGAWTLPGGTACLLVVGWSVVLMTIQTAATATSMPTFAYRTIGYLSTGAGPVKIRDNGTGGIAVIVDGTSLYVYNIAAKTLVKSTDPAWLPSATVAMIDGWFIFQATGTQKFFTSPLYWNGTSALDATYYALKDDSSDNLVAIIENNRQLWLIGESTTEPWYNAGGNYFPFSRLQGALTQVGCAAAQTVCRTGQGLMWLARSERGENSVIMTQGYSFASVTTPAVAYALNQYPVVNDALAYVYAEEGHEFYVLTLPTADMTWVYDLTTKQWHQRASFDPSTGLFHRQRVSALANFSGMRVGIDYQNGRIYWITRTSYADDQYPLVAVRRAPHVWDGGDRSRVIQSHLRIDFFPGAGISTGQGKNPQAMLKVSNDGGLTWGPERWASMGAIGKTLARAIWRKLGQARDRVYEVRVSDPVRRDIAGATIKSDPTAA